MRGLRLGLSLTGGGSFSPSSLGPLAWYDPSDLSTMFQDTAGTTPVTADGQSVALIRDKSGNGYHATQATASQRPLYKTSGGMHWLEFDGVDDCLQTSSINYASATVISAALAFRPLNTSGGVIIESGDGTVTDGKFYLAAQNDAVAGAISAAVSTTGGLDAVQTTATTYGSGVTSVIAYQSIDISQSAATSKLPMRRNGVAETLSVLGDLAATSTFSNQVLNIGARNNGASVRANARFHGLVLKIGALSTADLQRLETWIGAKAGVAL